MALYNGIEGGFLVDVSESGSAALCVASFTLDISAAMGEAACLGSKVKKRAPSIKSWSASFDGAVDFGGATEQDLLAAYQAGDEIPCVFKLNATTNLSGSGYLESLSISHSADGVAQLSGGIKGNGALTATLP